MSTPSKPTPSSRSRSRSSKTTTTTSRKSAQSATARGSARTSSAAKQAATGKAAAKKAASPAQSANQAAAATLAGSSGRPKERLRPGQLHDLVLDYLTYNPGAHSPASIAKALQRSNGAIANSLVRLTNQKKAKQVSQTPRRYELAA